MLGDVYHRMTNPKLDHNPRPFKIKPENLNESEILALKVFSALTYAEGRPRTSMIVETLKPLNVSTPALILLPEG